MDRKKCEAILEAILFTMGESVEISRLASVLEMDKKEVKDILKGMQTRYEEEERGIVLMWYEDSVQLSTRADLYEYLIKIAKTPKKMVLITRMYVHVAEENVKLMVDVNGNIILN